MLGGGGGCLGLFKVFLGLSHYVLASQTQGQEPKRRSWDPGIFVKREKASGQGLVSDCESLRCVMVLRLLI